MSLIPTVLLTRPISQCEPMRTRLEQLGFRVLIQPTIVITEPADWKEIDAAIRRMSQDGNLRFDWLFFTSRNAVLYFFRRFAELLPGETLPDALQIAVVGEGTAEELWETIGRRPTVHSPGGVSEDMLRRVLEGECEVSNSVAGKRFLLLRADRGRDIFRQPLEEAGAVEVLELAVYRSVDLIDAEPEIVEELQADRVNYTTATSSSIAASLVRLFGEELRKTRLVSISPLTTQTLTELGYPPAFEAPKASLDALVDILRENAEKNAQEPRG